jgi:hypothetical protein
MVDFIDNRGESPSFQIPTAYNVAGGIATPKAYAGTSGKASFYFYTIEQVNRKRSDELGYECKDTIEIVEFKNDSKCSPAHPIDAATFEMHPEILGDYQRWKQGKESDITEVRNWEAVGVGEIGMLIAAGFYSVEQVVATPDNELMVLGLAWKDIKMKAEQHMKAKLRVRQGLADKAEMSDLQKELAKRDAELAELRAMIMGKQPISDTPEVELVSPLEVTISEAKADVVKKAAPKKRKVGVQE